MLPRRHGRQPFTIDRRASPTIRVRRSFSQRGQLPQFALILPQLDIWRAGLNLSGLPLLSTLARDVRGTVDCSAARRVNPHIGETS
jgi:hypothetical protein